MDLKIKDVAELLNVSETTVRRWLTDGKIPAYRINHQYRFSRTEIENWVISNKLGATVKGERPFSQKATTEKEDPIGKGSGIQQYSLYRAINRGGVFHDVPGSTKEEIIRSTMKLLSHKLNLDADVLADLLLDRENLMPTTLNHGIGVPHTRDFLLNAAYDVVTIVFPKHPIENYGALDGLPVHTLFFLFASQDKRHLHLLAKIAHLSSDQESRDFLERKPSQEELLAFVKNWESSFLKV